MRRLSFFVIALSVLAPMSFLSAADEESQVGLVQPMFTTMFFSILTFGIVLLILKKYAWGPLLKALDDREARIRDSLMAADKAREETEQLHREHEELMAKARKEATAIVEEGKRDAQVVRDTIVADARRESEGITTRAKSEIERAKELAIDEIHERSVELSYAIAEKLIKKSLTPEDHQELVNGTIERYAKLG